MFCSNCRNEISENDKFCSKCGEKVDKSLNNEEKIVIEKEYGMKYYNFFSKYCTKLLIFYGIIFIFSELQSVTQLDADMKMLAIGEMIAVGIIYVFLPIKLSEEMPLKTENSYLYLIVFFISTYTWRTVISTIALYINDNSIDVFLYLLLYIIVYAIWYVPNMIYFIKRKNIFIN